MEIIIFFCTNHIVSAQRIVFKGVKLLYRLLCPLRLLTPIDSIAHVFFIVQDNAITCTGSVIGDIRKKNHLSTVPRINIENIN